MTDESNSQDSGTAWPLEVGQIPRGFLMGAADIVPGVSGGTVALILGIYERLVTAITRFDLELISLVKQGEWRKAAEHIDLKFLLGLGAGILLGIVSLASAMNWLIENHTATTFAVFFGLILGSSLVVANMIERFHVAETIALFGGTIFALVLVQLPLLQDPPIVWWYFFLCGLVAITAMILPGVSGSFILLLLGLYGPVTGTIRDVMSRSAELGDILLLGVFAVGAVCGLLLFSRLIAWFLEEFEGPTLACLSGVMLGSLWKLWPYKVVTQPGESFKERIYTNVWPDLSDPMAWVHGGIIAVFGIAVVMLERFGITETESPDIGDESSTSEDGDNTDANA